MRDLPDMPVRILVTERVGAMEQPRQTGDHVIDALTAHLQRLACEGARAAWALSPKTREWLEGSAGQIGWRAQIQPDTLHLIHVLTEAGIVEMDDA